jgi:tripartite-type tricarboxylate transporter receptor subunit TctC
MLAAAAALTCVATAPSLAQGWPQKTVRFIVPFPPGGGTDVVARMVAKNLQDKLGQTVIVENRGGANGAIGLMAVKQTVPDGYTFAFTSDTPMTVNPWLYKDLSYQPLKDFVPVTSAVRLPGMLAAHPSFSANTVAELIALAKQKPGSINYASAGVGNFSHLAMELFSSAAGVKLQHVPYKGTAPAAQALLSGEVQVGFNNVQTLLPHVLDGKLKPLGVAEPKRIPQFPNYPAVAETVPGFELNSWYGYMAPTGTPKAIINRLQQEVAAAIKKPDVIEWMKSSGLDPVGSTPDEYGAFIRAELVKYAKAVKDAKLSTTN